MEMPTDNERFTIDPYIQTIATNEVKVYGKRCCFCQKQHFFILPWDNWALKDAFIAAFYKWKFTNKAAYIQDAFPMLDSDQRELFITGADVPCWDTHMKDED